MGKTANYDVLSRKPKRNLLGLTRSQRNTTLAFIAPAFGLMILCQIGPSVSAAVFAFTNYSLTGADSLHTNWVGLENFIKMFKDPRFKDAAAVSFKFVICAGIFGQQLVGFTLALLMKGKNVTFRRIVGIGVIAASVVPDPVAGYFWNSMLAYDGTINTLLGHLGFEPIGWMFQYPITFVTIAWIWRGTMLSMLLYTAALEGVPQDIEEAAVIDGANKFQTLLHVILPMIKGPMAIVTIFTTLGTFGGMGLVLLMTNGGPGSATTNLPFFMYQQAFVRYQIGYGTAIALVIMAIGMTLGYFYVKVMKSEI